MTNPSTREQLHDERWELLRQINAMTDRPMVALAFVWLGLLILDFTRGLDPLLQTINNGIWALFIADFVIEFIIAPKKIAYLRRNWLTAISLVLPAFRIVRVFRAVRLLRAARTARVFGVVRLVSSLNRGMRAVRQILGPRGVGAVALLTTIVVFAGGAGMYAFENPQALVEAGHQVEAESGLGLDSYGESVWWTAMLMTSIGSEYWPQTVEGRLVCWLLSLYALAVFSYLTAAIASYFVGTNRQTEQAAAAPVVDNRALVNEIAALRREIAALGDGRSYDG